MKMTTEQEQHWSRVDLYNQDGQALADALPQTPGWYALIYHSNGTPQVFMRHPDEKSLLDSLCGFVKQPFAIIEIKAFRP